MPGGDFENPEGNPPGPWAGAKAGERSEATNGGRSVGPRVLRVALGVFKIPDGQRGSSVKIHEQKPGITKGGSQVPGNYRSQSPTGDTITDPLKKRYMTSTNPLPKTKFLSQIILTWEFEEVRTKFLGENFPLIRMEISLRN